MVRELIIFLSICCIHILAIDSDKDNRYIGETIKGQIVKSQQFQSYNPTDQNDFKSLKVKLNSGLHTTYPNDDGSFAFYNIPPGKYLLEVTSKQFIYEKYVISYYSKKSSSNYAEMTFSKINPLTMERDLEVIKPYETIIIKPWQRIIYFEKVEEFNILNMFKNTYVIMILVTILMMYCMKKLPTMEEINQQQSDQSSQGRVNQ